MAISAIIEQLKAGDKTIVELVEALGLSASTIEAQLVRMAFQEQAHVHGFVKPRGARRGGRRAMLWRLGPMPSARRVALPAISVGNTSQEDATVAAARAVKRQGR